jgi:stress-induced morphogen
MVEAEVLEERIRQGVGDVAFSGKSPIEQHQMVYAALGELMTGPVHALALKTYSPESWAKQEG